MLTRAQRAAPPTCSMCMKTGTRYDFFPRHTPTTGCEHPVQTCIECLRKWFHTCLDTHYQPRVCCPNCPSVLVGYTELSQASTPEDYARYRYIHARISRSSNPQWKYCLSPTCDSPGQRHPPSNVDSPRTPSSTHAHICQCNICGARSCDQCDRPWHKSLTCEEFQEGLELHRREDELSEVLKSKLKATGKAKECMNCGCLIEICSSSAKGSCARCLHAFVDPCAQGDAPVEDAKRLEYLTGDRAQRDRKVAFLLPAKIMAVNKSSSGP